MKYSSDEAKLLYPLGSLVESSGGARGIVTGYTAYGEILVEWTFKKFGRGAFECEDTHFKLVAGAVCELGACNAKCIQDIMINRKEICVAHGRGPAEAFVSYQKGLTCGETE